MSADADTFLEKTVIDDELNRKTIKLIKDTLGAEDSRSYWRFLLSGLPPQTQLKLLHSLINNRRPQKSDWQRIFKPLKYTFSKSWHYRIILIVAGVASLIALVQMFYPIVLGSKNGIDWFMAMLYPLIVCFWIALSKGINEPWEPSLFLNFGLFGSITFGTELSRLFRDRLIWSGIGILFEEDYFSVTVAWFWILAVTWILAWALAWVLTWAAAWVLALAVTWILAWAGALAVSLAGTVAAIAPAIADMDKDKSGVFVVMALTVAIAIFGAVAVVGIGTVAGAMAVAGTGVSYLVVICIGIGIGIWHSENIDNKIIKLFAFLSFPLFCWFPLVVYFSTTALLRFFPWQNVALTWLIVIATCTFQWFRGQQLDYQSRNPLQGLIPNPKEAQGISLNKTRKRLS